MHALAASAIILAGGKSSRMGRPKALLLFDGEPLLLHTVRLLRKFFVDVVVVAAPEQELPPLPVTVTRDAVAYQGPVGGIFYGLQAASEPVCFVTSCDAPFLNLPLIAHLLALVANHEVVAPHWQGRLQPLYAVYRRSVAPLLAEQLQRGELRPISLYEKVRTRVVTEEEIRRFDPEGLSFQNMNSPEDYQTALALWRERQSIITCTVELFGVARLKAKTARLVLSLPADAKLTDLLFALTEACPELVGTVIFQDRQAFLPGYACNLNGVEFVRTLDAPVHDGDQLLILSSNAGG